MKTEDFQVYIDFILDQIVGFMPRFLGGIFVLLIGWWLIKQATRVADKIMKRRKVEDTLRDFFKTIIRIALWVMLVTSVVTMIGIETTSVLALLTSIGVAVGLALSGTLQNFAGGLLILLMRHIKVGDEVEAQGHTGIIERIELFYTILITWDNEKVILPNGPLSTQVVKNNTARPFRRLNIRLRFTYGYDLAEARERLLTILRADERVLQDPAPYVIADDLSKDAIMMLVRGYVLQDDFYLCLWELTEEIHEEFKDDPQVFPPPKMDVQMKQRQVLKRQLPSELSDADFPGEPEL